MPKVYCRKCKKPLTEELTIIDTKYLYQELSVTGDCTGDFIPKGKIYYNTGKIVPEYKNTWLSGLENEYTIWDHYDIARLTSNSCFLDGRAGINSTCFKSHEVATKVNDCLMINFVSWDPERTELK
jgi:hypothetical protein